VAFRGPLSVWFLHLPARAHAPTGLVTFTVGTHLSHYIRTTTDSRFTRGGGLRAAGRLQVLPGTLMTTLFAVEEIDVAPAATWMGRIIVCVLPLPT
jgi:hypothetical protein